MKPKKDLDIMDFLPSNAVLIGANDCNDESFLLKVAETGIVHYCRHRRPRLAADRIRHLRHLADAMNLAPPLRIRRFGRRVLVEPLKQKGGRAPETSSHRRPSMSTTVRSMLSGGNPFAIPDDAQPATPPSPPSLTEDMRSFAYTDVVLPELPEDYTSDPE